MSDKDNRRPSPQAIINKVRRAGNFETCLHPMASKEACGKVVAAHTLPRSRVLRSICSADNHVFTFYPFEEIASGELKLHRRGWREASVFNGFCEKHDGVTFKDLETRPFVGDAKQVFLIAYRGMCWELYRKQAAIRGAPELKELIPADADSMQRMFSQGMHFTMTEGYKKGFEDAKCAKAPMDLTLQSGNYSSFRMYKMDVTPALPVFAIGAITPNLTLTGVLIQNMSAITPLQWLSFGMDVYSADKSSIVFMWEGSHDAPTRYMEEIDSLSPDDAASFISQFVFAHCENAYFSEEWWRSLSGAKKQDVLRLARITNPYSRVPSYNLRRALTKSKLVSRGMVD
jgi:hypothetical protein